MIKRKGVHLLDKWFVRKMHNKLVLNFSCYFISSHQWQCKPGTICLIISKHCMHTNFQRVVMALFAKMSLTLDSGGCQIMSKSDIRLVDPLDIYLSCLVQRCYSYYELHKKLIPNICSDDKLSTYNCAAALCSWLSKSVEFYMFFFLV